MEKEFQVDVNTRLFFKNEDEAKSFFEKYRPYLKLQRSIISNSVLVTFDDCMLFESNSSLIAVKFSTIDKSN